jgi:hypothetical protein
MVQCQFPKRSFPERRFPENVVNNVSPNDFSLNDPTFVRTLFHILVGMFYVPRKIRKNG